VRGYGLSDWDVEDLSLEARVGALEAVADAAGLERCAVMGMGQGGQVAIIHAARSPERVTRMILSGTYAGVTDDYRARFEAYFETLVQIVRFGWTLPDSRFRRLFTDSLIPGGTEAQKRWVDDLLPRCTSRDIAIRATLARRDLDVTDLLGEVKAPTLVLHSRGNRMAPFEQGRLMASNIPDAQFVPFDSDNSTPLAAEPAWPLWLDEVTRFLAPERSSTSVGSSTIELAEALSEREVELLYLVAGGLTNDEIAERLTLSGRTVERHLSNIYRKLGVSGRSARAAAVAHILQR
jgi:pimeloyl-ACP methyl ester carboxylesterase/DNA-binding CsgD family transcriptional regulator